jgi:hypothetical protein
MRTYSSSGESTPPPKEAVLEIIRSSPGASDRDIAERLFGNGTPGSMVTAICRELAEAGLTRRRIRSDYLLGNWPREDDPRAAG